LRQGLVRAIGGVAMVALIAGAAACNSSSNKGTASGSGNCGKSIAFFGALTGSSANLGVNIEHGAELAVTQYNGKHSAGCVKLEKFDSQGSPDVAPGVARQLVQNKNIIGIIGPAFSGESVAADPIFNEAGIPLITPSATNPVLATGGQAGGTPWKVFHRAVANDASQGPAAGNYIKSVLKSTKVFIVDDQSSYGSGLAAQVTTTVGASNVVGSDKVGADGKQTDFSSTVTKITSSGADVLFYGGYYQNAGLLRKQLTAAGWKGKLVAGDGAKDPGYVKAAGVAAAAGSILTCPCAPPEKAGGTFVADYKKQWGVDAGTYSDVAFDAANIFLQGIDGGNITTDKMLTYVNGVDYKGVANEYKFQPNGELDPSKIIVWAFKVDSTGNIVADQATPTT
jgi:branched-chain amino acid transport system substrate-binding protein